MSGRTPRSSMEQPRRLTSDTEDDANDESTDPPPVRATVGVPKDGQATLPRGVFVQCGTFGCTLPDNHRGLHKLPDDDSFRTRRRPQSLDSSRESLAGGHGRSDGGDTKLSSEECQDIEQEELDATSKQAGDDEGGKRNVPPSSAAALPSRESSGRKRMPSAKLRAEDGKLEAGGRRPAKAPKPMRGDGRKSPSGSAPSEHGSSKEEAACDRNWRCVRGHRHPGVCKVLPPCPLNERCIGGAGHGGVCRPVPASRVPKEAMEGHGAPAEKIDARRLDRILAQYADRAGTLYFLLQWEGSSRGQAVWAPRTAGVDEAALRRFDKEQKANAEQLVQIGDPADADSYQLLPPRDGEEEEAVPPVPSLHVKEEQLKETEGLKLCKTFGCTLPNHHFGLHKLPPGGPRQRRTALRGNGFSFKDIATKGLARLEIPSGRQLAQSKKKNAKSPTDEPQSMDDSAPKRTGGGSFTKAGACKNSPPSAEEAHADSVSSMVLSASSIPHAAKDPSASSEAAAALLSQFGAARQAMRADDEGGGEESDDDDDDEGEEEEDYGFQMPGGLDMLPRARPRRVKRRGYAIGAKVRYMRTGDSYGCFGTIVDAKCGYWVISMDNNKQLYARGSMLELVEGANGEPVVDGHLEYEGEDDNESRESDRDLPFTCVHCGRKLANAGSRANHERACLTDPDSADGRAPRGKRPEGQCRRNPLCVRGLRHRGFGGPCKLKKGAPRGGAPRAADPPARGEERGAQHEREVRTSTVPGRVGHAIVGRLIEVYWAADDVWQQGLVRQYNPSTGKHMVEYVNTNATEHLTLAKERWRQQEPEESSEEDADEEADESEEERPRKAARVAAARVAAAASADVAESRAAEQLAASRRRKSRKGPRSNTDGLFGMLLEASVNVPGAEAWQHPRPAANLSNIRLLLTDVQPDVVTLELCRSGQGVKAARIKEVQDAWFAIHKEGELSDSPPTRKLGAALRCRPLTKLPGTGVLSVKSAEMSGLSDGRYVFAVYSQHKCVAETRAVERVGFEFSAIPDEATDKGGGTHESFEDSTSNELGDAPTQEDEDGAESPSAAKQAWASALGPDIETLATPDSHESDGEEGEDDEESITDEEERR